jgi:hypothetical protein
MLRTFCTLVVLAAFLTSPAQDYDAWFDPGTLRIDYFRSGNASEHRVTFDKLIQEGQWAGSRTGLVTPFNFGEYKIEVWDTSGQYLLFAQGFSTLFREWQTTAEAKEKGRSFRESVRVPFPAQPVQLRFLYRDRSGQWQKDKTLDIIPEDPEIMKEQRQPWLSTDIHVGGPAESCLDLAIVAEGYAAHEMEKFLQDARRFSEYLFATRPYNEYQDHINIRAVHSISPESGTDFPHKGIWKRTLMNSRFFTFGSDRYLTTDDYHSLMDVAANVPWDQVLVLVNSKEYGGGGIYNHYLVCTSDHPLSDFVFVHELGHSLAGLADEYYTSSTAYESFYNKELEPWEPNITTLVNFPSKWQDMLEPGTPVPSPDNKSWQEKVGVFEGAGYSEKGIYRPYHDCTMNSAIRNSFCPVCLRAIRRMMESYSGQR